MIISKQLNLIHQASLAMKSLLTKLKYFITYYYIIERLQLPLKGIVLIGY